MPSIESVRTAADHLRARAEVAHSRPAELTALMLGAAASALGEDQTNLWWPIGIAAGLVVLPALLRRILPKGNLTTFRLELAAYPLCALLLGFIAFLETSKLPPLEIEELPRMNWLYPALAAVLPLIYLVLRFPGWRHRFRSHAVAVRQLRETGDPEVLAEVQHQLDRALTREASAAAPWAEFHTVPAAPRNWKLFLRLDLFRHGPWRVVFAHDYALVVAKDGSGLEVVTKGGLRIAADDPAPGGKPFLCLVRWNEHLHEARIREGSLRLIQSWNTRTVPEGAA